MKWYVSLCAILVLIASPAALADIRTTPDGGGGSYGYADGDYDSGGTSCYAWAYADGSTPDSGAVYWASVYCYTTQGGWFKIGSSWGAWAVANYGGSDASAAGGGTGSAPLGGVSASASVSYPGPTHDHEFPDGDSVETEEYFWFDADGGVSAESACGAYASAGSKPGNSDAAGGAQANAWLTY
ncbi:MAG: hypothetical protein FJ280_22775 [Planctomycetes bacterium]|nr:hypothetical protein [Planctomycetota bacterium]